MNAKEKPTDKISIFEPRSVLYRTLSLCLKTFAVGASYLAGLFDISICWMIFILVLFKCRDDWRLMRKFNQYVAMVISLRSDRRMIEVNPNRPPPWVNFPEIEVCEWLNKILSSLWPTITKYTEESLKNKIEPSIIRALSAYTNYHDFKLHILRFGSVTPRVCGLKICRKISRNFENIVIDLRLYYAGDNEIYCYLMSLAGGGVQNVGLRSWIRIVFRLLVKPCPILGGIEIFFLRKPKVDYNFTGAMDFLKIPGISGMLQRAIDDQLRLNMVLPNRITIETNEIVNSGHWKCPDLEGIIRVQIVEAKHLNSNGSRFFDPYVTIHFGSQTATSDFIFDNSVNPKWNFWANFMVDYLYVNECILITVNERSENASLGKVLIDLSLAKEKKFMRSWVQLEDTPTGMIHLEIYYYDLTYRIPAVRSNKLLYALVVFIDTAFNLVNPRLKNTPNSTVYLEVGLDAKVSKSVLSENPVFEEAFLFFIDRNPEINKIMLKLKLVDIKTKTALGNATIPLKQIAEAKFMEKIDQVCPLLGAATESSLSLSMRLRHVKH